MSGSADHGSHGSHGAHGAAAAPYVSPVPVKGAKDVKVVDASELNFLERAYVGEVSRGLGITFSHMFETLGKMFRGGKDLETISYPEQKKAYPPRFRGLHRLLSREDGTARCVACFMCATACPAVCIKIVAEPRRDGSTEKQPRIFEIDELRCVDCGLCVEACPCDAIRMDTALHPGPSATREDQLLGRWDLLRAPGVAADGDVPRSARTMEGHVPGREPKNGH